jgi:O-methyltransferase
VSGAPTADELRERYLSALRRALIAPSPAYPYRLVRRPGEAMERAVYDALRGIGLELVTREPPEHDLYEAGGGWPVAGLTMIGDRRLEQLQRATEIVLRERVAGDLIETGVWRGGATILMRAVLYAHGVTDRTVWVADSFEGVPPPDPERYPADRGDRLHLQPALAVPLEEVRANHAAFDLDDGQVRYVPGWFRDTLPQLRGRTWSVIRLDGDLYESTMDGLVNLYPSLSPGGFLIVDDWGAMPPCREAVECYRREHGITEPIEEIDWTGVYWRKAG